MSGEAFALLAAVAFALGAVLSRRFMEGPNPVLPEAGVFVSMLTDAVVFTPLTLWEVGRGALQHLTPASFALFLVGGVSGTVVGRNLAYLSVQRIGPSRSTAVRLVNVVFSTFLGLIALRELPRPLQITGAALITAGLWWVLSEPNPSSTHGIDPWGVVAAAGAAFAFALGDTLRRRALGFTPFPFLGASIGAWVALVAQVAWFTARGLRVRGVRIAWHVDVVASALANTAAILLLFLALQRTAVANAAVLYNLQVLLVILLSRRVLRERIGLRLVAGSLVCLLGTAAVLFG